MASDKLFIASPILRIFSTPEPSMSGRFFNPSSLGAISLILLITVSILATGSASPPVNHATNPLIALPIFIPPDNWFNALILSPTALSASLIFLSLSSPV